MSLPLPARTEEAEDAFIGDWSDSDDTDGLIAAIETAMTERRPKLAARLVGLLGDHVEIEPGSALDRASAAARLFLTSKARPEDNSWSAMEEAWIEARRAKLRRIRQRQRGSLSGDPTRRIGRLDRRRR